MMIVRAIILIGLCSLLGHAETYIGKCELTADGKSAGERNCRITTNSGSVGNCPGKLSMFIPYDWHGLNGWGAFFDVTDGSISGSCTLENGEASVSGTMTAGELSGTLTRTFTKGTLTGTTVEIRFTATRDR